MELRFNEAACGFLTLDHNGTVIELNNTFLQWLGYSAEDIVQQHFEQLLSTPNKMIFHSYFYPNIHLHGKVDELFIYLKHKDGTAHPFLVCARKLTINGQELTDCFFMPMTKRIIYETELRHTKKQLEIAYLEKEQAFSKLQSLHQEIEQKQAELLQMNKELIALSNTDKLTGIPNRRYFDAQLAHCIDRFHAIAEPFSLCLVDIDFFKKVNDTYGHIVGDYVLQKVATLIQANIRPQDTFARFGGEEFGLLLPNIHGTEAFTFAQSMNKLVEQAEWSEIGSLTISIGVELFKPHYTATDLIESADQALYVSKLNGRNQATLADSRMV